MAIDYEKEPGSAKVEQKFLYESGNEMAAYAAHQINYHVMGYFPISPSTEVAQFLDTMKASGQHDIMLVPSDGEHSSPGSATALRRQAAVCSTQPALKGICSCWSNCLYKQVHGCQWS